MNAPVSVLLLAPEPLSNVTELPPPSLRSTLKGSLERGWYIDPTFLIVMALLRLFLTRVVSGVALHATVTVRAGRRAWAGSGESPCLDIGPAVIVNISAAITAVANSAVLLIPIHLSLVGRETKMLAPLPVLPTSISMEVGGARAYPPCGHLSQAGWSALYARWILSRASPPTHPSGWRSRR